MQPTFEVHVLRWVVEFGRDGSDDILRGYNSPVSKRELHDIYTIRFLDLIVNKKTNLARAKLVLCEKSGGQSSEMLMPVPVFC